MNQVARLAIVALIAVIATGCTAGAPMTVEPPAATEAPPEVAQATTTVPQPTAPTATMAMPTEAPPTAAPPTNAPSTATAAAAIATDGHSEPAGTPANSELAYRAQASGRPAPPPPPADGSLMEVWRGPYDRLEVALTFDAGADTGYAADILDTLQAYGIKATFGMTGVWAQNNPDLIRRMANEGHQLINHTWSHASFTGASTGLEPQTYEMMLEELNSTEQVVWDIAGYEMKPYVRPPYGDYGPTTSSYLVDAGYYINVMWTCDSFGWKGWDAAQIVSHCTTDIGPGEIILLHVGASAPGDYEALPGLIETFSSLGYNFVTIEQMLQP